MKGVVHRIVPRCIGLLLLSLAAADCGGDEWREGEAVVFEVEAPDTAFAGQPTAVRVSGACGCLPCTRFDGIVVRGSGDRRELVPLVYDRIHPPRPCPACDHFFDETVFLMDLQPGTTIVTAESYGVDPADTVIVLDR